MIKFYIFALLGIFNSAVAANSYEKQLETWSQSSMTGSQSSIAWSQKLERLYKLSWEHSMVTFPEFATFVGYPGQNDRWTDMSFAAIEDQKHEARTLLKVLQKVPVKVLQGENLITFKLFKSEAELAVESQKFPQELLVVHQMGGVQQDLADLMMAAPKRRYQDYLDRLARLKAAPRWIEQVQALLAEGLKKKITPAQIALKSVPSQIEAVASTDMSKNPIYATFNDISGDLSAEQKAEIQNSAKKIITETVAPAFTKLHDFFVREYLPACRQETAWSALPDGKAWYQFRIKYNTTTDLTAEQIHEIGLQEVRRLRGEMEQIREKSGFKGDFAKFNLFLKEDDQFYFKDGKDLMTAYREIAKKIDPELPRLFVTLPRLTYGVREMPAFKADSAPTAYYQQGSLEAGRAGNFEANTFNLRARPKWQMEALTLHEAVPGHHLQIALAQELKGFPEFRKNYGPNAFVEGWGLYAESLGDELGLYKDIYSKYGQLSFEMWRAIRLVVDTGLHAKGWSRDQVMQYFRDNGPFTEQQIINETDRYIADPGQALAYKLGEMKFKDLKKQARGSLGERFDIRKFHDVLLGSGALPLKLAEDKVQTWLKAQNLKSHTPR
jgi:uncharacterized protein (DUF885 family)